jgi:hypothetical protein
MNSILSYKQPFCCSDIFQEFRSTDTVHNRTTGIVPVELQEYFLWNYSRLSLELVPNVH